MPVETTSFWQTKEFFAAAGVVIAAVFTFIGVLVGSRLTRGREDWAAQRQGRKETTEALKVLYADAVTMLDEHMNSLGMGDAEYGERLRKLTAQMELRASDEVRECFSETANLIDEWADHRRRAQPEGGNGILVFMPGSFDKMKEQKAAADEIEPKMWKRFEQLKRLMSEDLRYKEERVYNPRARRKVKKTVR